MCVESVSNRVFQISADKCRWSSPILSLRTKWDPGSCFTSSTHLGCLQAGLPKKVSLLDASPSSKPTCLPVRCLFLVQVIHSQSLMGKTSELLLSKISLMGNYGSPPDFRDSIHLTIIRSSVNIIGYMGSSLLS